LGAWEKKMTMKRFLWIVPLGSALVVLGAWAAWAQVDAATQPAATAPAETPSTAPATTQAVPQVPGEQILAIRQLFRTHPQMTKEQRIARLEQVLTLGAEAERNYPDGKGLAPVRLSMMQAAGWLAGARQDAAYVDRLKEIGDRVHASSAAASEKAVADFFITRAALLPPVGERKVKDVPGAIRGLEQKYADGDGHAAALIYATVLAAEPAQAALRDELAGRLEKDYLETPGVRGFLRGQLGRHPDIGKVFRAELTRLDGTKLTLPEDLAGKVVVVDFWASWCTPCVKKLPVLKAAYAQYKTQAVEFVGISLDSSRKELNDFLAVEKLPWIQTCSYKGWDDPTVEKYGVGGIPNIWVLDAAGRVVSDEAEADLAKAIEKALAADRKP